MGQKLKFGHKKLYLDGKLQNASDNEVFEVVCPGNEEVVATISWASKKDTLESLKTAQTGFEYWSKLPINQRLDWISKLRDKIIENEELLREAIMYEMGKAYQVTEEDFVSITNSLKYYPEEIKKRMDIPIEDKEGTHEHYLKQQPLGVAVAFLAYNFPLLNLGFKLGPALAAGCSIILKPSEFSPLSAYIIGELCHEIDFPKGVINVICGDVEKVGVPLCESTIPRLITMIGSTETAQKLIQQSSTTSIKKYSMECGGNAPFIVFEDGDLEKAIEIGADLKIWNTGQICVAANRYYIQKTVIDEYAKALVSKFQAVKIGFGRDKQPDMGPLANETSVVKLQRIVEDAVAQGGKILCGGKALDRPGHYFEPTVILIENQNAAILDEEVFGPIVFLTPFKNKEEVILLANNTDTGLASYVFSLDQRTLDYFAEHLEFGEIQLNGIKYDIYLPHGGIKNSGIGVDCSEYALDDYLIKKRVSLAL